MRVSRFRICNFSLFLLCLPIIFSACSIGVRKAPFQWPVVIDCMEGTGDIDLSWRGRKSSGSFALKLESQSVLLFEVYGPFGQTVLHVKKEGGRLDIISAEGRTEAERFFEEQYGMHIDGFIDDLFMRGMATETSEGKYIDRTRYRVLYTSQSDRPRICWVNPNGSICLTFAELSTNRNGQNGEGSSR
jgi:hypothetical protein